MAEMTQAEIATFLQEPRNAIAGTNRVDGPPQQSPVWFIYEDGLFYIGITKGTAKYYNLRRDPRISLCIDGGHRDSRTVMVAGTVTIIEKENPRQQEMRGRLIRHYIVDEAAAREYEAMSRDWDSLLLVVTPETMLTQNFNQEE